MNLLERFCSPAKLYLGIAFLSLLYYLIANESWILFIIKAVTFIAWAFVLKTLCSMGYNAVAWFAATVPHFIFLIVTVQTGNK